MASRALRIALLIGTAALLPWSPDASARQATGADDWKYDVIYLRGGAPLKGLIVEESRDTVLFKQIDRKPGRPTIVWKTEFLERRKIERIDPLSPADREELRKRLEILAREREALSGQLKPLGPGKPPGMPDAVPLETVDWPPDPKRKARAYVPPGQHYFRLVSTAKDEVTILAALRLEQVYAAYARYLPPRIDPTRGKPTLILLTGSLSEYDALMHDKGLNFFNPAFYDVKNNQIVCGSDLQRLADERDRIRQQHALVKADLEQRRAELNKAYKGRVPPEMLADINAALEQIPKVEKNNDEAFNLARRRLFRRLYHEAFHAYLATWVYPGDKVPVWLNEGLAQLFETAIVEVGELRADRADPERVRNVRLAIADGKLPSLKELLASDSPQFLVNHARERQVSDRYYLASWGLAFYLTFERRLLGTKALDDYIKALQRGTDPLQAFQDLVGMPLAQFEKEYLQYLQQLPTEENVGG
jgi:hypothetical protein